eukprot:Hpha_TRINITY_DN15763_c5_g11::TRINITY_DN15763_c5_g11_i1::g.37006::m.37006
MEYGYARTLPSEVTQTCAYSFGAEAQIPPPPLPPPPPPKGVCEYLRPGAEAEAAAEAAARASALAKAAMQRATAAAAAATAAVDKWPSATVDKVSRTGFVDPERSASPSLAARSLPRSRSRSYDSHHRAGSLETEGEIADLLLWSSSPTLEDPPPAYEISSPPDSPTPLMPLSGYRLGQQQTLPKPHFTRQAKVAARRREAAARRPGRVVGGRAFAAVPGEGEYLGLPSTEGVHEPTHTGSLLDELRVRYDTLNDAEQQHTLGRVAVDEVRMQMDVICAQLMASPFNDSTSPAAPDPPSYGVDTLYSDTKVGGSCIVGDMADNMGDEVLSVCRRLFDDDLPTHINSVKSTRDVPSHDVPRYTEHDYINTHKKVLSPDTSETLSTTRPGQPCGVQRSGVESEAEMHWRSEAAVQWRETEVARWEAELEAERAAVQSKHRHAAELEHRAQQRLEEAEETTRRLRAREDELNLRLEVQDTREGAWQLQQNDREEVEARCLQREAAVKKRENELADREARIARRFAELEEREMHFAERQRATARKLSAPVSPPQWVCGLPPPRQASFVEHSRFSTSSALSPLAP